MEWDIVVDLNGLKRCLTVEALLIPPEDFRCGSSERRLPSWVSSNGDFVEGGIGDWERDIDSGLGRLELLDGPGGGSPMIPSGLD